MRSPRRFYYLILAGLAAVVAWALSCWIYQVKVGMRVTGLGIPVGWGVYIANFVFWVGIAHSGTLISAILHLVRSRWRAAVARAAEAMTVFAVITAGLFPMIHLGRVWVVYYIFPYPSQRQLWPNFMSPLVWDVVAVSTYLIVSTIFWYVGLIPDLASARDRWTQNAGPDHQRTRLYRVLSLGFDFSASQWRHYGRGFLFFAALATPLVISVHSVVSWDFAISLLPGWHSTIFPPYFVAGAIHSGLAMVLTLLIPLRRVLRLERIITPDHFDAVARTIILTALIVGYAYLIEPFMAFYSGDLFEGQFALWRAQGWLAWAYWALIPLNVLIPLAFLFRKVRRSLAALFVISLAINVGMWLERFFIVVGSLSHDFLPHNWSRYAPSWVEISITAGSFAWFLFWFIGFSKLLPTVAISEVKETLIPGEGGEEGPEAVTAPAPPRATTTGIVAVYSSPSELLGALRIVKSSKLGPIETYTPFRLKGVEQQLGRGPSPVRYWTLTGALLGLAGGFALAIGTALVNSIVVGGKSPASILPYCVIAFEGTILIGTIFNLIGVLAYSRLGRAKLPPSYEKLSKQDRFSLFLGCRREKMVEARRLLVSTAPEEIHVLE
jgi:molybdopterin-containing oxidoreductase family membrane subunit